MCLISCIKFIVLALKHNSIPDLALFVNGWQKGSNTVLYETYMAYSVTQNTSFLTAASLLQKVISSVYFFVVAHFIGEEITGDYFNIFASIAIFTVIADFGLGGVLIREISKHKDRAADYFNTIFSTKLVCSAIAIMLMFLFKLFLNYPAQNYTIIAVAAVVLFFDSLQNTFYGIFRAYNNVLYESYALIGAQIITLGIGVTALIMHAPLVWLVLAFAIPSCLSVLYAALCLYIKQGIRFQFRYDTVLGKQILFMAFPFALSGLLVRLYAYSDSVIMNTYLSRAELGWWGMAYKITYVFQLLPVALGASIYPVMSRWVAHDKQKIVKLFERSYHYLLLFAFPIMAGIIAFAPILIPRFLPRFTPSVFILQILILSIGSGFLTFVHGATLNAMGKQTTQTFLIFCALVFSVILNVLLIPRYGAMGAAITAVVSNMVWCIGGYIAVSKMVVLPHTKLFWLIQKLFWPALFMGGIVYALSLRVHFSITIVVGTMAYIIFLFVTGGLSKSLVVEFNAKLRGGAKESSVV